MEVLASSGLSQLVALGSAVPVLVAHAISHPLSLSLKDRKRSPGHMDKARDVGEGTSPADALCPGQQRPKPLLTLSINPDISAAPFHPQQP